jgi:uncharacterized protein YecE (DUF72 family)
MKIHVGTSGYGYKEWKGIFYPEKIAPKEMLRYYSERLDAVEINNTFYRMPTENVLSSWADQVPAGFLFAIKAPQVITHLKRLRDVEEETDYLVRTVSVLRGKMGPLLFQFPKSFRADQALLEAFLDVIPRDVSCAFDFRSPSWLEAGVPELLRERGCCLCIEDTDENPADEIIGTTGWGYLRLRRPDYTDADLVQWLKKIGSQRWKRVFVFFKHEEEAKGAELAMRFRELAAKG